MPHEPPPTNPKYTARLPGLDGLRAVSIGLVLLGHSLAGLPKSAGGDATWVGWVDFAHLGVTTFFVLSGYLITHLLIQERAKTGTLNLPAFYGRRIRRIFPAMYFYLGTVGLLILFDRTSTAPADLAIAGTFLTNFQFLFPPTGGEHWFVGHFWTLAMEEQFYLVWPATLLLLGLRSGTRIALAFVLGCCALRVAAYLRWPVLHDGLTRAVPCAEAIVLGCLAALMQGKPAFERVRTFFDHPAWPLAATLFLLGPAQGLHLKYHGLYLPTVGGMLNGLAIAFLVLWILRHSRSPATRFLETPVLKHVGRLSYSLYLWQQLFLTPESHSGSAGHFPLNLLMAFAFAELSFWGIEQPFLNRRKREFVPVSGKSLAGAAI